MGIAETIVEKLRTYCHARGIKTMYLFGSYARKEATPLSDIDLLIKFEEGLQISYLDLLKIKYELEDITGTEIDLVEQDAIENPIRRTRILEERVLLYAS
ncbi:MAG: nucleotidyltransferase domain-containing protein [Candidatus Sabulitectum sp.]|nr:nucleotidyltransferase domain-containing protein [Candidatus Sabulitectum sp.]